MKYQKDMYFAPHFDCGWVAVSVPSKALKISVRKFACFRQRQIRKFTDFGPLKRKISLTGI